MSAKINSRKLIEAKLHNLAKQKPLQIVNEAAKSLVLENKQLRFELKAAWDSYLELYGVFQVLLQASPTGELRLHESQLKRYHPDDQIDKIVVDSTEAPGTKEIVYKLTRKIVIGNA